MTAAVVAAGLVLATAAPSVAREKQAAVGTELLGKATIESVDMQTRHVLLRGDDGTLQTVTVGPQVQNLGQVKPGDRVSVRVRLGVLAQMAAPNDAAPPVGQADIVGRAAPGARPAGLVGEAFRVRVTFNSYDPKTRIAHITLPDGNQASGVLHTKTMQDFAAGLKAGDKVDVTFIRSVAIAVTPGA
ncbi:hypothetical protein [Rhodopila sp.]|uniref:hypothetical protein n=1 Tax=Rhodopila sp. TaxID=2480087 RepID=UPI002BCAFF66|nr:hypothetical protein [Rhodopila sp.]HVZ09128.1 hypothetical protein [Rhodopila sp.]